MQTTIPRNELSVIMLHMELVFMVARVFKVSLEAVIFLMDSTIALSWCSNKTKKL